MEVVLARAREREVGEGLDELYPEECRQLRQMVLGEVMIDRDNNLDISRAISIEDESVATASHPS